MPGAVGVNNHMGSAATADPRVMRAVVGVLSRRGLFFLDSRTTDATVAEKTAEEAAVPAVSRRVFLDDVVTEDAIRRQLDELVRRAKLEGEAVAIGHPYPATLAVLEKELPGLAGRGVRLVRVKELVRSERRGQPLSFFASSQYRSSSAIPTSATSRPLCRARRATPAKRSRNRRFACRRADSGSILRRRARLTTESSRSPISCVSAAWSPLRSAARPLRELLVDLRDDVRVALPVEAEVRRPAASGGRRWPGPAGPAAASRADPRWPRAGGACAVPTRVLTSCAFAAGVSPKTWGWRSVILRVMPSATSSTPNQPRSSASFARKKTWKSRSPSSSRSGPGAPSSSAASVS